jgi:hypothetical protein
VEQLPELVQRMAQLGYVDVLHSIVELSEPPRARGPAQPPEALQIFVRRNIALFDLLNDIVKCYSPPAIWHYNALPKGQVRAVTIGVQ